MACLVSLVCLATSVRLIHLVWFGNLIRLVCVVNWFCEDRPVSLVSSVCLVCLVRLATLVSLISFGLFAQFEMFGLFGYFFLSCYFA